MGNSISWAKEDSPSKNGIPQSSVNTGGGASAFQGAQNVQVNGGNFNVAGGDIHVTTNHNVVVYQLPDVPPSDQSKLLDILNWISGINYRAYQSDTYKRRTLGTGTWLVQSDMFQNWLKSKGVVLWGTGIPGAGKTVLASIVISYLEDLAATSSDISVAYAYCRYTDQVSVSEILAALIRQQVERHPFLLGYIEPTYTRHILEKTRPSEIELLKLLKQFSEAFRLSFYSIDGLDEVPQETQFDLAEAISLLDTANFMLTSRPLNPLKSSIPAALFFQIVAQAQDIDLHIAQMISRTPAFERLLGRSGLKGEVISTIREKSQGMFLHAFLQLEMLRHCLTVKDLQAKLKSFPAKIEDMYAATMERINELPEEHAKLAKTILIWLINAQRSLTLYELRYAVATCPETHVFEEERLVDEEVLVSVCCGLVHVDAESGLVRLVHYTATDALPNLLSTFCPNPHALIAQVCMARLTAFDVPHSPWETELDLEKAFATHPLLKYAYQSWGFHTRRANEDPQLEDTVLSFLKQCSSYPYPSGNAFHTNWGPEDDPMEPLDRLNPLHVASLYGLTLFLDHVSLQDRSGGPDTTGLDCNETTENGNTALILGVRWGHEEIVGRLLEIEVIDVNAKGPLVTALMEASYREHERIVEMLLACPRIDINVRDAVGRTALGYAMFSGNPGVVRKLLGVPGIDVNFADQDGMSPLIWASLSGRQLLVEQLIARNTGIDVNAVDKYGGTALIYAAGNGHATVVQQLLSVPGIDVNAADGEGRTPFIMATSNTAFVFHYEDISLGGSHLREEDEYEGREAVAEILIDFPGIQANLVDKEGRTALMLAAVNGLDTIVARLLKIPGIDINRQCHGETALTLAVRKNHESVVKLLMGMGELIDVNARGEGGSAPLLEAASNGHELHMQLLLATPGVDVNLVGEDGETGLMLAASEGHVGVVDQLLAFVGIDVNASAKDGTTALILASSEGHEKVVEKLLEVPGIDVNMATEDGMTAFMVASRYGKDAVLERLIGFDRTRVDMVDRRGRTALMMALYYGHEGAVSRLLKVVGVGAVGYGGETPLRLFPWGQPEGQGHDAIVSLLKDAE